MRLSPPLHVGPRVLARALTCIAVLAATNAVPATHAMAADTASPDVPSARQSVSAPPIKDCTRVNGRYGYYANQWCTPAEQTLWDKWEAARLKGR